MKDILISIMFFAFSLGIYADEYPIAKASNTNIYSQDELLKTYREAECENKKYESYNSILDMMVEHAKYRGTNIKSTLYKNYAFFRYDKKPFPILNSKGQIRNATATAWKDFLLLAPKDARIDSKGNLWTVVTREKEKVITYFPAKFISKKTDISPDGTLYDVHYIQIN